jgi:hypothetical protein
MVGQVGPDVRVRTHPPRWHPRQRGERLGDRDLWIASGILLPTQPSEVRSELVVVQPVIRLTNSIVNHNVKLCGVEPVLDIGVGHIAGAD